MAVPVVDAAPSVVTITVHITLNGEELPPEASRLLSDLEALAANQASQQIQRSTTARPSTAAPQQRTLRLVDPSPVALEPELEPAGTDDKKVRRIGRATPDAPRLYLCTGSRLVLQDGVAVPLTRREYDLFLFLCEHPRRVFSRAQLLRQVWGYDMVGTERTVDVHVRRLRVKLGGAARIIATVRGVGYRLDDDAAVQVVVRED
ncbi:winged helix-turn-helix domain-containing protein [Dactylosporangium sp. NPDC051485]|uniref:winged helix-turn-helix domain-containing protein n=1 Tax=Dactylosporangium sp. NPDC051485 TaxID=3154846 RepID=UPI0034222750